MDKSITEKEKQRLKDVIKEETRSYHMLASTLQGFNRSEVDCCQIAISAQWIEYGEVLAIPSEKIHGARPIVIRGETAIRLVKRAIDGLENDIDYHQKQLNEMK